jgi:hypothetical protein
VRCRPKAATRWIDRQGPSTVLFQPPRPTTPPSGDDHVDVSGCYTTKCDTVEDGLTERASKGNQGEGVRRLTQCYHVTQVMSGEMGNLVVNVDVKENVEAGPMMANTELLEAWVSSGKVNSVSGKTNRVIRVASG